MYLRFLSVFMIILLTGCVRLPERGVKTGGATLALRSSLGKEAVRGSEKRAKATKSRSRQAKRTKRRGLHRKSEVVVKRGDTLSEIAHRHGLTSRALASFNNRKPNDLLRVGERLRLPQLVFFLRRVGHKRKIVADVPWGSCKFQAELERCAFFEFLVAEWEVYGKCLNNMRLLS